MYTFSLSNNWLNITATELNARNNLTRNHLSISFDYFVVIIVGWSLISITEWSSRLSWVTLQGSINQWNLISWNWWNKFPINGICVSSSHGRHFITYYNLSMSRCLLSACWSARRGCAEKTLAICMIKCLFSDLFISRPQHLNRPAIGRRDHRIRCWLI